MPKVARSFRLPRVRLNEVLRKIAPLFSGEIINVSGWDDRDKEGGQYRSYFSNAKQYYISNYSGERGTADAGHVTDFEIDLTAELPEAYHQRFEVVFNHTTLEHVFEVDKAFSNLCQMSSDVVIVIVPFAQEVHFNDSYGDYWRFTPMVLRRLFEKNGLQVIYEAANDDRNAGLYVISIGSRHPGGWSNKMPGWRQVNRLGEWIGETPAQRFKQRLKQLIKRN